jgi:RHS repeat-associated protein
VPPVHASVHICANELNQYKGIDTDTSPCDTPPVAPDYDLDGNLVDDGTFEYTWDMENRLVAIEPKSPVEDVSKRLEFRYDTMGRRIRKIVNTWKDTDPGAGVDLDWVEDTDGDHLFIYDDWNVILVLDANDDNAIVRKYTWGLDLSGQSGDFTASGIHGAGGIAGLLAVDDTDDYWYLYDANGNVGQLVENATNYPIAAKYEYDPYGKIIGPDTDVPPNGEWKDDATSYALTQPFRFSTKWLDHELAADDQTGAMGRDGFYYYGERYYIPEWGRWGNEDPIEERGGLSLYLFVANAPTGLIDPLGLEWVVDRSGGTTAKVTGECGDSVFELAAKIRMRTKRYQIWLKPTDGKPLPNDVSSDWILDEPREFEVPNKVVVGVGQVNWLARLLIGDTPSEARDILVKKGFSVDYYDYRKTPWKSSDITKYNTFQLYGIVGFGHGGFGKGGKFVPSWASASKGHWNINGDTSMSGDWLSPAISHLSSSVFLF